MSAVYGVNNTKALAGGADNIVAQGKMYAKEFVMTDTYEASSLASGSTIAMGYTLPAGAIITGVILAFDDLSGGTTTLSVGDSNTAARYLSAIDAASAASVSSAILVDGLGYVIGTATGDNQILITTGGGTAATGTIKLVVKYGWV